MNETPVKRSRDDVIDYLRPFGIPEKALDSLRGSFDLWHDKRVGIEQKNAELMEAMKSIRFKMDMAMVPGNDKVREIEGVRAVTEKFLG